MKFLARAEKSRNFWFLLIAFYFFRFVFLTFEPYWYGDEGIYQVLGMAIRNGRLLYRDIWDNKPPLSIFSILFNSDQFWLRLVSVVFGILALIAFYALCKNFFSKTKWGKNRNLFNINFGLLCTASRRRKHCKCRKFYALLYYSRRFSNFFRKREIKKQYPCTFRFSPWNCIFV